MAYSSDFDVDPAQEMAGAEFFGQGDDNLNQIDFSNIEVPDLNFEIEPAEPLEEVYLSSGDNGLGAGEPGPDILPGSDRWVLNGPQGYGDEGLFSDAAPFEQVDVKNEFAADGQYQLQEFPSHTDAGLFNEYPGEQSGITQDAQEFFLVAPMAFSNTTPRRSVPAPLDMAKVGQYEPDPYYLYGEGESDSSVPCGEDPKPKNSPLDGPIETVAMNNLQRHARRKRGSTDLCDGKIKRNTRRNKGDQVDPKLLSEMYYGALPALRQAWGPIQKSGKPLFSYNQYGEVAKGKAFDLKEMRWYLYDNKSERQLQGKGWTDRKPVPGEVRRKHVRRSGLTLWIGWTPAQANDRYPSSDSNKCKLRDCAFHSRTIKTGDPRVIFDERCNERGDSINPYYNAAYCHLYCFEKYFNLVQLAHILDVRLDDRHFDKEEQNLSVLKADEYEACRRWFQDKWPGYCKWYKEAYQPAKDRRDAARKSSPSAELPAQAVEEFRQWSHSLTSRMMEKSLVLESKGKAKQRERRRAVKPDSCDRDVHKGDLDFAQAARNKKPVEAVGNVWDAHQLQKYQRQQAKWEESCSRMKPEDRLAPRQELDSPCQFNPPEWMTTNPAKRPRPSDESEPAEEMSHSTRRRRLSPIGVRVVPQASSGMTYIDEQPSHFGSSQPQIHPGFVKRESSPSLWDIPPHPSSAKAGMSDTFVADFQALQEMGPDTMNAMMNYDPSVPVYDFTSQDDAIVAKQEKEGSSEIDKVAEYDTSVEVKTEEKDFDFTDFIQQQDAQPKSPGSLSSLGKRKREEGDDSNGEQPIKRRCSVSSR
ncbi:hypothetical protein PG993_001047 [Apiospora rasikravindrae]|uniref:Uncharacterized protein n=1 Tax=Apiospora rasikravindrae TaxID=990691 RepID=A0ABR1UCI2_9PEZI